MLPPLGDSKADGGSVKDAGGGGGIRPGLKRGIIILTLLTFLGFGVFGAFFIKSITKPKAAPKAVPPRWDLEILTVAQRLEAAGLFDQALGQYEQFLAIPDLDSKTRGRVSFLTGNLYLQLDNCPEALVFFYQAKIAQPEAPWASELTQKIDGCLAGINQQHRP